ncbi:hypothetical protein ACFL1T_04775 [Chlamydiota bacterium]
MSCLFPTISHEKRIKVLYDKNKFIFITIISIIASIWLFSFVFSGKILMGQIFFYKYVGEKDNLDMKESFLERAIFFDRNNATYLFELGKVLYEKAQLGKKKSDDAYVRLLKKSIERFNRILFLVPLQWRYHFYRGLVEYTLSTDNVYGFSKETAERYFNNAVRLNPTEYDIVRYLGDLYLEESLTKAVFYYRRLLKLRSYALEGIIKKILLVTQNPYIIRKAIPDNPRLLLKSIKLLNRKGIDLTVFHNDLLVQVKELPFDEKVKIAQKIAANSDFNFAVMYLLDAIEETAYFKENENNLKIKISVTELLEYEEDLKNFKEGKVLDRGQIYEIAEYYYNIKEYSKSVEYLTRLDTMNPSSFEIQYKLALSLYKNEDYKEAYDILYKLILLLDKNVYKDNNSIK